MKKKKKITTWETERLSPNVQRNSRLILRNSFLNHILEYCTIIIGHLFLFTITREILLRCKYVAANILMSWAGCVSRMSSVLQVRVCILCNSMMKQRITISNGCLVGVMQFHLHVWGLEDHAQRIDLTAVSKC